MRINVPPYVFSKKYIQTSGDKRTLKQLAILTCEEEGLGGFGDQEKFDFFVYIPHNTSGVELWSYSAC